MRKLVRRVRPRHVLLSLITVGSLGLFAWAATAGGQTLDPAEEKAGGDTTVFEVGRNAFSFPAANIDEAGRTTFAIGNSFFRRNWVEAPSSTTARDGLCRRGMWKSSSPDPKCARCSPTARRDLTGRRP